MTKKDNNIPTWAIILIVIIVIIIVVVFVISLGTVNAGNVAKIPKEFKDTKEEAKRQHDRLKGLVEKQVNLRTKLEKRFRRIYFSIRVGFVIIWFALLTGLFFLGLIKNLGDALNYSEALILLLITFNFLTFGTITKLETFIELLKLRVENWVYGKYVNINEKIELNKSELEKLTEAIS